MLEEANQGFFFQAPDNVTARYPAFPLANDYPELQVLLSDASG
jgi:hypothetical protein